MTAGDIVAQTDATGLDAVVVPDNMLREFGDVFLDNVTVKEVSEKLGVTVITVAHNGSDFVSALAAHFAAEEL